MSTRLERVILELQDDFSRPVLQAAAAAQVLDHQLDHLSGSAVRVARPTDEIGRSASRSSRDIDDMGRKAERTGASIDKLSGRVSLLASTFAVVGPSVGTIGAVGIPAVSGLAAQFGFAALGAGVAVLAFHGMGDALKAMNKAGVEPTAENLKHAREAMSAISPDAQKFVRTLRDLQPQLRATQQLAAEGVLPGVAEGLESLATRMPDVQRIVGAVAGELGDIGASVGDSLASARWDDFFTFLETDAPQALGEMASTAGNTAHAMAELWMAFDPANDGFSTFLLKSSADLDKWATGLSKTQGFGEFLDYIQAEGPQVADTIGAISNMLLQVIEAGAPIGGPVLRGLEDVANIAAKIADSDLGTPIMVGVAAWRLYALAAAGAGKASSMAFSRGGQKTTVGAFVKDELGAVTRLPAAYREAAAANKALTAAQARARTVTAQYVGTLKASNTAVASGLPRSAAAHARLADALGKVEMANYGVSEATKKAQAAEAHRTQTLRQSAAGMGKSIGAAAGLAVATSGMADGLGLSNTASLALMGTMAGPLGAAVGGAAGLFLDLGHSADSAEGAITRLNQATRTGNLDQLGQGIKDAKKELDDFQHTTGIGDLFSDVQKGLKNTFTGNSITDGLKKSLGAGEIAQEAAKSRASLQLLREGFVLTGAGARTAAMGNDTFSASLARMYGMLAQRGSLRDLEASIDDYRSALKKAQQDAAASGDKLVVNGKINIKSSAGRDVQAALDRIAQSGLKAAESVQNIGQRAKLLDKTRGAFIRAATAAGIARGDARRLANQLISLDQLHPVIPIKVNLGSARSAIHGFIAEIASAHPVISVGVKHHTVGGIGPLVGGSADGSTVPKTGRGYADRHLYLLADGEEVISNRHGQADRNRDLLKAINNNRLADGGTIKRLAAGGTAGYASGQGVTVYFPAPSVLEAAVKAADAIAVSGVKYAASAQEVRSVHLDDLHLQQQIHEAQKSLVERDDKVVGKGKHKKTLKGQGGYSLKGIDRTVANAELYDLRAQLLETRKQSAIAKALADAQKEALAAIQQQRTDAAQAISGGLDLFASGSASRATRDADRYVADVAEAGDIIAQLRTKGASPILLQQMIAHVQQGDAKAAVKLGRTFLAKPALITQINASLSTLGSVSQAVATMTTDPTFAGSGTWKAPANLVTKVAKVEIAADPSTWMSELRRQVTHDVISAIAGG